MNSIFKTGLLGLLTGLMIMPGSSPVRAADAPVKFKKNISENPYIGAIVVDAVTGRVLVEDKPDAKGYPASMLKLMDLLIIQEKIEQKQLTFQDQVPVSAKAAHTGGTSAKLREKESFTVDEMLYALMLQSANDAAVALAEKVAGSTDAFIELMNQRAKELGMTSTVIHSVNGLPDGEVEHDMTTPRDFVKLCRELLRHKDTLRYTSTIKRNFRENDPKRMIVMVNHDHLLGAVEGVDGFKTGYFHDAGYSIAVTAARGGQRVIAIVLGSTNRLVRDKKAAELVSKGFLTLSAPVPKPAR